MIDFVAMENQRSVEAARTMTSFSGYCSLCGAMVLMHRLGGGRSFIDPLDGAKCHGDVCCNACLTRTITNDRICKGCAC